MPPRLPRVGIGFSGPSHRSIASVNTTTCPICTFSQTFRCSTTSPPRKTSQLETQKASLRRQSGLAKAHVGDNSVRKRSKSPRSELHDALVELQKHAGNYVNISRLQLALRGLEQKSGQETIRIAILALADGGKSLRRAKELLRLLLADPLKPEEEWERTLIESPSGSRPILLTVGHDAAEALNTGPRMVQELHVSSVILNGHKLEILLLETDSPETISTAERIEEALLVPTMEIPTSSTGRYTPVTTPVHKSLLVSQGIAGAASLLSNSLRFDKDIVSTAVDIKVESEDEKSSLPFQVVDITLGDSALASFRESIANALDYERMWFASGAPELLEWIKSGTSPTDGTTKIPLQKLIESLLNSTNSAIQAEEAKRLNTLLALKLPPSTVSNLRLGLSGWAETAHTELRDQLDFAFNGHRWRKLGWWKLFWRVDDVSMIATDILNRQFLTQAEKQLIFLTGRIVESGIFRQDPASISKNWAYKSPPPPPRYRPESKIGDIPKHVRIIDIMKPSDKPLTLDNQPWPLDIPRTRQYLTTETVPALQALAQKLVLQTLTTSSVMSAFAALTYVSTLSTGIYEAGGIAALGIVWSLQRMQGKWETARRYWEGEVREEGRKAVKGVESIVEDVLKVSNRTLDKDPDLEKAKALLEKADAALQACK